MGVENLERIYGDYLQDMNSSIETSRDLRGLLGSFFLGPARGQDSCNQRFVREFEQEIARCLQSGEDCRPMVEYIFNKGAEYKNDRYVGMMFTAMYGYLSMLLSDEEPDYKKALANRIDAEFSKRERTPVMLKFRAALE